MQDEGIQPGGTATENVSILDEAFYFPGLGRHRRLWVYLPQDYHRSEEHYPVIYMHDGQNLFDEFNAFGSEWGVDETLDAEKGNVIVIGIDNGAEHRMSEYMLHDHPDHGSSEGAVYLKDVTEVLKPWVDSVLRTRPEREHTAIAGSSMGGLISLYAGLYFPHISVLLASFRRPYGWTLQRSLQKQMTHWPGIALHAPMLHPNAGTFMQARWNRKP